jgi:uncharacterized protein YneF (UPF0154 family)
MRHTKLILLGIILLVGIVFGSIFWSDLIFNQQELANTPVSPQPEQYLINRQGMSDSDRYDAMDKDLDETDVNTIDSNNRDIEAELNTL